MKTKNKIFFDRLVCVPSAIFLNLLARSLSIIVKRNHDHSPNTVKKIIVAKFKGLGSIVQTTPFLASLKKQFPDSRIIFLTSNKNLSLVRRLEFIDEIVTINEDGMLKVLFSSLAAIFTLIKSRSDLYFDLEVYSAYASCMTLLAVSRNRYGFYRWSTKRKIGIYTHLVYFNTRVQISEIYLQLGSCAGCKRNSKTKLSPININNSDFNDIDKLSLSGSPLIVINPNASDLMIERRWPLEKFRELITELKKISTIVLIGSDAEKAYVSQINDEDVINLAGKLSLGSLLALLKRCNLFITNDTGPMHFACALETPTVALFGPVDPKHYGIQAKNVITLYKKIYCSPCVHEVDEPPCRGNNVCMQRISVREVLDACMSLLQGKISNAKFPELPPQFFTNQYDQALGRVERGSIK